MTETDLLLASKEPTASLWPLAADGLESPPDDPVFLQMDSALQPLRPLLRWLSYSRNEDAYSAVFGLGSEWQSIHVLIRGNEVFIDLPIGQIYQRADDLVRLLQLHTNRSWKFRIDQVLPSRHVDAMDETAIEDYQEVVLVLEHATTTKALAALTRLVVAGWREGQLSQALLRSLRRKYD
ncbi:hypothetical protein GCM10008955_24540 [Deinococcus malanensis]|uniref:Uncharacterized protein n=1 Tax=Deinococcus malanensis TaxID=1706855 RepID=A0ABQ2EXJ0_9DEIO|nr:hypothetical protein [Deinococcus malanensis]GGK29799.1 hypothetical protein GCM10008955_24540 [Deinococcus malanensis]